MSLYIASLNSGSNGNCYYVGNTTEAILVDVGISCKEIEARLLRLNLSISNIKALFITHEHGDHIKGLEVFSKKHQLQVYISKKTEQNSKLILENHLVTYFNQFNPIVIGNLIIKPFSKNHDAADPYSFIIEGNNVTVGVLTDIGSVCENVITNFKLCNAAFLEANYDDDLLQNGNYPYYLKVRIQGNNGHLSNQQALNLFTQHKLKTMSHLILAHLSKDNNCPILVKTLFTKHAKNTQITVASRLQESEVYCITQ